MIRWGIIGAGRIAHRFVAALQNETDSQLYAISCRTQDKADAFACQYGNIKAYAGFDHIVNDPDVDAKAIIYNEFGGLFCNSFSPITFISNEYVKSRFV